MDLQSQFRTLREVASLINSASDLVVMMERLVKAACQHSTWAMSAIMSVDQRSGYAHVMTRFDPTLIERQLENRWALATSPALVALTRNEPVIIPDACLSQEFPGYREEAKLRGYHTVVVLPMGCVDAEGRSMVLTVQSRNVVDVGEHELNVLSMIAHLGALAVEKAHHERANRARTERLQAALSVQSSLMSQVLSDGSVATATAAISDLFPNAIIAVDFSANLIVPGRSPRPDRYDDGSWQAAVKERFGRQVLRAARIAVAAPRTDAWDLLLEDSDDRFKLSVKIEPLVVDEEPVGALIIFPRQKGFEDLDMLLLESAKFALCVQVMRSHIRFQNDARTLSDLFGEILEKRWRDAEDIKARALRLGIDLGAPAYLIAVSLPRSDAEVRPSSDELQRALIRCVEQQHKAGVVVVIGDMAACHAAVRSSGKVDLLTRAIVNECQRNFDTQCVVIQSAQLHGLEDYAGAWEQCLRLTALAHRFGRRGVLSARDFGPFPMLLAAANAREVKLFVDSQVGAVAAYDAEHKTEYLETLRVYLDHGCRNKACADAMGLHVTTLRYRLIRIEELFGIDIETQERRFALELAIRLYASIHGDLVTA